MIARILHEFSPGDRVGSTALRILSAARYALFIGCALYGLAVIGCSKPDSSAGHAEEMAEFVDPGDTRCAPDDAMFCAASRLREPVRQSPSATL